MHSLYEFTGGASLDPAIGLIAIVITVLFGVSYLIYRLKHTPQNAALLSGRFASVAGIIIALYNLAKHFIRIDYEYRFPMTIAMLSPPPERPFDLLVLLKHAISTTYLPETILYSTFLALSIASAIILHRTIKRKSNTPPKTIKRGR